MDIVAGVRILSVMCFITMLMVMVTAKNVLGLGDYLVVLKQKN